MWTSQIHFRGAAKRYERQRGAEATPRSWGRRSGDELRASSLRPSGEEERVVWSRQFPASWGPLGIRVSGSTESSTSPLDKCVRVARVSAQLRSVCSLRPRGLPGSRREGALCQGPRSALPGLQVGVVYMSWCLQRKWMFMKTWESSPCPMNFRYISFLAALPVAVFSAVDVPHPQSGKSG